MGIEWWRDLVIVIAGTVFVLVLVFRSVLDFILFRKKKAIMTSFETTARNLESLSSYFSENVIKPVSQIVAVVQGVSQGLGAIKNIFK